MPTVKIIVPYSGELKEFKITPEQFRDKAGWRVIFDDGKEEIIGQDEHHNWKQLNGSNLDLDMINELGKAIEDTQQNFS